MIKGPIIVPVVSPKTPFWLIVTRSREYANSAVLQLGPAGGNQPQVSGRPDRRAIAMSTYIRQNVSSRCLAAAGASSRRPSCWTLLHGRRTPLTSIDRASARMNKSAVVEAARERWGLDLYRLPRTLLHLSRKSAPGRHGDLVPERASRWRQDLMLRLPADAGARDRRDDAGGRVSAWFSARARRTLPRRGPSDNFARSSS